MKNLLIKATLVVLLSANVLTPMVNAGELDEIPENTGTILEDGIENGGEGEDESSKNPQSGEDGEGSDDVLLLGKEVAPTGSGTEDFYESDESGKNPLPDFIGVSPLSKGEQSGENGEGEDDVISKPEGEAGYNENPENIPPTPLTEGGQELDSEDPENPQSGEGGENTPKDPQSGEGDEDLLQEKAMPLAMPLSLEPLDMAPLDPVPLMAPAPSQTNSTTVKDLHLYFVNGNETKHYTIMDRNMGASDIKRGGYYYQWGNNYGFTHPLSNTTGNQVPYEVWSGYENAPSTYESSTFVKHTSNWQGGDNTLKFNGNLWGGKDDESFKNGIGTKKDRQGPCATGYYVPSAYDFNLILNAWTGSYPNYDDSNHNAFYDKFASDLLLTLDGKMSNSNGSIGNIDSSGQGHYRTSSPANGPNRKPTDPDYTSDKSSNLSRRVTLNAGQFSVGHLNRSAGMHVRCFKDDFKPEGTTPPLTIHLGSGQKTVIAVDADGKIQTLNDPSGSGFKGWYTTENFLNTTKVEKGDTLSGTDLYARWEEQEESFVVEIKSSDTNSGTVSTESITVPYGISIDTGSNVLTIGTETSTATESTDTDQYDFSFDGWTNNCGATVTTGCTITANFKSEVKNHTVTIESNNTASGTVSTGTITVPYGTSIDTGSSVLKIGTGTSTATESTDTDQYDFSFVDWTNNCGTTVTTGCTITANFKSEVKKYEITWLNDDGSLIDKTMVEYGAVPTHADASKTNTAQYTYTFVGWTPTLTGVTGPQVYTAQFSSTVNEYLITFVDGDGNTIQTGMVAYGETPVYTGTTPTKTATAQYTYTFNNTWSPAIESVTTGVTYTAQFDSAVNEYLITFVDGDGKTIQTGMVAYGDTPNYTGTTPTKTATAQYTYTWNNSWSPAIESVTTGATYAAQFDSTVNEYLITFVDGDGKTIQTGMVAYGDTPNYTGTTPTKTATAQYTYTFTGWSPAIGSVAGETTYIAEFSGTINQYTITFVDEDGTTVLGSGKYDYGTLASSITPADPTKTGYLFDGWTPSLTDVKGDQIYTAKYRLPTNNGGGGGSTLKKDYCPDGDYSDSYYDGDCGMPENDPENDGEGGAENCGEGESENCSEGGGQTHGSAGDEGDYTYEELSAYEWAYKNGITTIDNIQDANPNGYVTRGHMAKMVVNFMINVLGFEMPESMSEECLTLNNGRIPRESEEIRAYAMQSCALGVMGIGIKDNNFLANDIVSRAELGTIISRILWGSKYNVKDTKETLYYTKHLEALNKEGIMTLIDRPLTRKELRKRVWVMMKRIAEKE